MTKYRIVQRAPFLYPNQSWYFAQYKMFNLIWVDCDMFHLSSCSPSLRDVSAYVRRQMEKDENRKPLKYLKCFKQTVIRTYDS